MQNYADLPIRWLRQQKHQGKLRAVFRLYALYQSYVIFPFRLFWRSKVSVGLLKLAILVKPTWIEAYLALGQALENKYHRLAAFRGFVASELLSTANGAIRCYQQVIALNPSRIDAYQRLSGMLFEMNYIDEALSVLEQTTHVQTRLAEARQLDKLEFRFLSTEQVAGNIGVIGMLDGYLKAQILGWRRRHKTILLLPEGQRVSNSCFLNYWRPYITVISDNQTIESLSPLAPLLEDRFDRAVIKEQTFFGLSAYALVQKHWYAEHRAPLLKLTQADYRRGWECLRGLGIPKGAWFVCLHVRDAGFKDGDRSTDEYRNSDINSYLLTIEAIVAKGGWVIRMGDPAMKPLPSMSNVIDYAHSDVRSDWMDVFCCAQCRFFIGTSSGLYLVATSFGVPYVQTNYLPLWTLWFSSQDLFIPKLCRSAKDERLLTFAEQLSPPLSTSCVQSAYDLAEVEIIDNTQEEIYDVVVEMMARLNGEIVYSQDDEQLQARFNSLTNTCRTIPGLQDFAINCRIGRNFLRKYESLLPKVSNIDSAFLPKEQA